MFCKNCGKEMKESDAFCPVCGTRNDSNAAQNAGRIDGKAFQSNMANYAAANMAVQKKSQKKPLIIVGIILAAIIAVVILAVALLGSDISTVKNGSPYDYPDKTWGEVLDESCKNSDWSSFTSEDGDSVVEYNGVVKSTGVDLCIQFKVDDDEFEIAYMEVDGENCSLLEIASVVAVLFED